MTTRPSDRHEGDLGGRLRPLEASATTAVTLFIEPACADEASIQHTAWMCVDLLVRLAGLVTTVGIVCPQEVELQPQVIPKAADARLGSALLQGALAIGLVPAQDQHAGGVTLYIGPGPAPDQGIRVHGEGWWGGFSRGAIEAREPSSRLPFGPYAAAALAVGQIFMAARVPPTDRVELAGAFFNTWEMRASAEPIESGPSDIGRVSLDLAIAGVGAVGCTAAMALWSVGTLDGEVDLIDDDQKGVDLTNLNRYPLFGHASLGRPKASEAARILGDSSIRFVPYDCSYAEAGTARPIVLSAVDRNDSRREIALQYPARVLSGSTSDLRAELNRMGPPGMGVCPACYNPLPAGPTDEELRARVGAMSAEERHTWASQSGVSLGDVEDFVSGKCGRPSDRLRQALLGHESLPDDFAVGFVSALAGTLLAAEGLKETMGAATPLHDTASSLKVNFWDPRTALARANARDPRCTLCVPGAVSTEIWRRRWEQRSERSPACARWREQT
jgi:hypothetical protein